MDNNIKFNEAFIGQIVSDFFKNLITTKLTDNEYPLQRPAVTNYVLENKTNIIKRFL